MDKLCNTCIHKIVCSKYIATGGVNNCEHFKEERKGRWMLKPMYRDGITAAAVCSRCRIYSPVTEVAFQDFPFCPDCGADMRGDQCE